MLVRLPKRINVTFKGSGVPYQPAAIAYLQNSLKLIQVRATEDPWQFFGYGIFKYSGSSSTIIDAITTIYNIDIITADGIPVEIIKNF